MRAFHLVAGHRGLIGALAGLVLLLGGCSDPSKESGTQVKVSEETKAQIEDMRAMYKEMGKNKGN